MSLESSDEAPINKHRPRVHKHLEKAAPQGWHWGSFARAIGDVEASAYDDLNTGTLPFLLGDCLAVAELRVLFNTLLDSASGLRQAIEPFGLRGAADFVTQGLGQPQLLQLLLLLPDPMIISALDECVQKDKIHVPRTEIRRPVVNAERFSGAWGRNLNWVLEARASLPGPRTFRRCGCSGWLPNCMA